MLASLRTLTEQLRIHDAAKNVPVSQTTLFVIAYAAVVATAGFMGLFRYPPLLVIFMVLSLLFVCPVTPFCIMPDAKGTSDMSEVRRKSAFVLLTPQPAPVEGSKPLNFKYSPMWIEYKISSLVAPALYALGVTPNMVTMFNLFYRACFLVYVVKHPDHLFTNFFFMYSSQCLDALDGLMARRWKMFSEFGAWLDVTLDDVFGVLLVTLLFMFYWNRPGFIVGVFIIGVVLVPTAALAYNGSMAIVGKNPEAAKKIGAGGVRAMNFYEVLGAACEEYMACILFLVCWLYYYAAQNDYWQVP